MSEETDFCTLLMGELADELRRAHGGCHIDFEKVARHFVDNWFTKDRTMTEFQVGDIVRMTKGEPGEPGYRVEVRRVTGGLSKSSEVSLLTLKTFSNALWNVELIERPAPPLPTKPNTLGWVTVDGTRYLARLADGLWEVYDENGRLGSAAHPSTIEDFTEAVLIPKKLADKVMGWADDDHPRGWYTVSILQQIADHLKGQDDE